MAYGKGSEEQVYRVNLHSQLTTTISLDSAFLPLDATRITYSDFNQSSSNCTKTMHPSYPSFSLNHRVCCLTIGFPSQFMGKK